MVNNFSSNKSKGQSLVEFALTLLILVTLLVGVIDLGFAFFSLISLRDAAEEGAAYGSIDPYNSNTAITNRVTTASTNPLNLQDALSDGDLTVTITRSDATGDGISTCPGDALTVALVYQYTPITPFLSTIIGNTIDIDADATSTILTTTNTACP